MTIPVRIKRLADELKMRRRRLDAFRNAPPWPGRAPAQARELEVPEGTLDDGDPIF